jgi:hypothetical protein
MGNSVRYDIGYGYGPVQGHAPFGPPVLNCQCQGSKVYTLRVQNQSKQGAHSGPLI